jgi:hypothetical protein
MIHLHLVSNTFPPTDGGMEQSLQKIAYVLSLIEDFKVHVYIRNGIENGDVKNDFISYRNLSGLRKNLLEPYEDLGQDYQSCKYKDREIARIEFLTLKNEIKKVQLKYKNEKHVIISFYISSSGFFSQHVSMALDIPHIASVRGCDFSKDFRALHNIESVNFVLKYANHIITTNDTQKNILGKVCPCEKITTIYNSAEKEFLEKKWTKKEKYNVEIFSDNGLKCVKGSHILLKSFDSLISNGYSVVLKVFGKIEDVNKSYWENKCKQLREKHPHSFFYGGIISEEQILENLMDSDIYCSPTFGEGCSNSRVKALSIGIPIVSTLCGEILDFQSSYDTESVKLTQPAEIESFTEALEEMILKIRNNNIKRDDNRYYELVNRMFSPECEGSRWEQVIRDVLVD